MVNAIAVSVVQYALPVLDHVLNLLCIPVSSEFKRSSVMRAAILFAGQRGLCSSHSWLLSVAVPLVGEFVSAQCGEARLPDL